MDFHPIKRSPISAGEATVVEREGWQVAEMYSSVEAEVAAVRRSVGMADLSTLGKIMLQGRQGLAALKAAFGVAPEKPGEVVAVEGGLLACLTREDWFLTTPLGGEAHALERLGGANQSSGAAAYTTDVTHGYGALLVAGPKSADVMLKVCGLDFHPRAFPNHTAKQSSVARIPTIILRDDAPDGVPAYQLHVGRSAADYLWGAVWDAATEFEVQAVGAAALGSLYG
jgi:heterotetrameric sarcosine oxidase gamma subunit